MKDAGLPSLHFPDWEGLKTLLQNRVWSVTFFLFLTHKPRRNSEAGRMVGKCVLRKPKCLSAIRGAVVNKETQAVHSEGKACPRARCTIFCSEGDL